MIIVEYGLGNPKTDYIGKELLLSEHRWLENFKAQELVSSLKN